MPGTPTAIPRQSYPPLSRRIARPHARFHQAEVVVPHSPLLVRSARQSRSRNLPPLVDDIARRLVEIGRPNRWIHVSAEVTCRPRSLARFFGVEVVRDPCQELPERNPL